MWLYYCLICTLLSGFTSIVQKKCSNNDPKRMAITGLVVYHSMMLIIGLLTNPEFLTLINIKDMLYMVPGILLQSIGFFCCLSSIKYGKVTIASSIQKTKVVVTFLLGIIILNESFSLLQLILSITLVILSILLSKQNTTSINKKLQKKSILYSYGFVIFNGTSNFINKVYITHFDNAMYVVFNYAVIMLFGILLYCLLTKKWDYISIKKIDAKYFFLLQSALDVSASIFNRLSLQDGNVSVISIVETSSIVITVLFSRILLKEKITLKKYLMIFGIFICVLLLSIIKK